MNWIQNNPEADAKDFDEHAAHISNELQEVKDMRESQAAETRRLEARNRLQVILASSKSQKVFQI